MRPKEVIQAEIAELERLLRKRKGKSGYSQNVIDIEEQLAAAKAELAEDG